MSSKFIKFSKYNLYEKGLAQSTVDSYVSDLNQFFRFIVKADLLFSQEAIDNYFDTLGKTGLKNSSIKRKQMSLRCFVEFLNQSRKPSNKREYFFDPIKKETSIIKIMLESEYKILLDHCERKNNFLDKCIIAILYNSGIRVSELISLNTNDVNIEKRELKIKGKGCKDRVVPISIFSTKILNKYMQEKILEIDLDFRPLFVNNSHKRINRFYVRDRILNMCRKCRINDFSPHDLRHSCATNLLNNGMELDLIKVLLGHNNVSETQIYLSISQKELKKTHEKFHPRK